jgi:hypothetical protein
MTELQGDLRIRVLVHEVDDAFECWNVLGQVHAAAARRNAAVARNARHLGEDEARAAESARTQMHEMEIVREAVDRAVHVHGRHDNAVAQFEVAQAHRREHRRDRFGSPREPAFDALDVGFIAQAQVFVTDALAAR